MNTDDKLVAAAKRAARKAARASSTPYQTCLDDVARQAGRRNWSGFLADPVPVDQASANAAAEPDFTAIEPTGHLAAVIAYADHVGARRFMAKGALSGCDPALAYGLLDDGGHEHPIDPRGLDIRSVVYAALAPDIERLRFDVTVDEADSGVQTIHATVDGSDPFATDQPFKVSAPPASAKVMPVVPLHDIQGPVVVHDPRPEGTTDETYVALSMPVVGRTTIRKASDRTPPPPGRGLPDRDGRPSSDGMLLGTTSVFGRKTRSAPDATVLVVGPPATGKTSGIVLPAILDAGHLNVVVRDPKGEMTSLLGEAWEGHPNRLVLDCTSVLSDHDGGDPIVGAFNVLHPEMRYADIDTIASDVADILVPTRESNYFADRARRLLRAAIVFVDTNPGFALRPDGAERRHPSLPAVDDLFVAIHSSPAVLDDAIALLARQGPDSAHAEFAALRTTAPRERMAVIGTVDHALLPLRNRRVREILDPALPERGAMLARAIANRTSPALVLITGHVANGSLFDAIDAIIVETAARLGSCWAGARRPMHLHVEGSSAMAAAPWIRDAIHGQQWPGVSTSLTASSPDEVDRTVAATFAAARGLGYVATMPGCAHAFAGTLEHRFGTSAKDIVSIPRGRHMLASPRGVQTLRTPPPPAGQHGRRRA